jgi:predicted acyltransferase
MARITSKRSVRPALRKSIHKAAGKSAPPEAKKDVSPRRVVSIDALRGFDMFWIMGGDAFFPALFTLIGSSFFLSLSRQLEHSEWNGFTFYDLIFPLFLFIVGCSMPFALGRRLEKGEPRKSIYVHIIKRTVILLILGLIYNGLLNFHFSEMRYAGVLQRIAICYFFASVIFVNTKPRTQAILAGVILLGYWAIMKFIPVPGFGAGNLTPEGNLAAYLDRQFLPGRFCCYTFGDNEGILSNLPAVVTVLLGALSGEWLNSGAGGMKKAAGLAAAGIGSLAVALLWNPVFPINKLFWSSSYVLYAGGWSMLLLALFYWIIDVRGWRGWAFPFVVIGLNPITIYVVQGLFDFGIIATIFVHGFIKHTGAFQPAFWSLCVLTVKWLFLYFLYKQKIFLKA